ncbi:MAG TPA: hypothetical protein VMW19_20585 [Myxococcota bacterium]|nr:hypothetical protein [Myxococcota bacterium]
MVDEPHAQQGLLAVLRRHPILTAIFALCITSGAVAGALFLPQDWSLARRIAGGVFAGAGTAVFLTVTRLFD